MKKYRLEFYPNVDARFMTDKFTVEHDDIKVIAEIGNSIANYTLFLQDKNLMLDHSNMMFYQELENGEYYNIDIDEVIND